MNGKFNGKYNEFIYKHYVCYNKGKFKLFNSKNSMYVVIMVIYRWFFLEFYKEYLMEIYL